MRVILIKHGWLKQDCHGAKTPVWHHISHLKARAITYGPIWRESARLEHRCRYWVHLAPPKRCTTERDNFIFKFHRSGYTTQEPRLAARHVRPWIESDRGSGPTVRYTNTEPANVDSPMTAHAPLCTHDNNPIDRTTTPKSKWKQPGEIVPTLPDAKDI
jgi:hypothetical protein